MMPSLHSANRVMENRHWTDRRAALRRSGDDDTRTTGRIVTGVTQPQLLDPAGHSHAGWMRHLLAALLHLLHVVLRGTARDHLIGCKVTLLG
jgi:hypothetical protein